MQGKVFTFLLYVYLSCFTIGIYLVVLFAQSHVFLREPPTNYYNYLLDAFSHGRLNILSPVTYDLSLFQDKWYLNWGPAPILLIFPFYVLWGLHASDVFYTLFIGLGNTLLFVFVAKEFSRFFQIYLSLFKKIFIVICFAFISPNIYLTTMEGIWHTEQITSIFYLLCFLFFYFSFLNYPKRLLFFVFSIIFYNLAWLSRYSLVFHGFLFLYPFYLLWRTQKKKFLIQAIAIFSSITMLAISFLFTYNYSRFHNIFETGIHYHQGAKRYMPLPKHLFSLSYVENNVYYYFLHSISITMNKPYLHVDPEGNSVFEIYPVVLLIFLFLRKKYREKQRLFLLLTFIVIIVTISLLLCYFATGWMQFGNRFFFDIIPLLFLSILFVLKDIPEKLLAVLLVCGMLINIFGILSFDLTLL